MMDSRFLIVFGSMVVTSGVVIAIIVLGARRRRRALAAAGPSQGFQPIPFSDLSRLGLVPILEHPSHTFGQALQGNWGSYEVLIFDFSYRIGKRSSNQTLIAFRSPTVSFPKFQLRKHHLLGLGAHGYAGKHVQFDSSPEFGKRYFLAGADAGRLLAFFDGGMRDYLYSLPDHPWTIEGYANWLVFYRHGHKTKASELLEFARNTGPIAENIFNLSPRGAAHFTAWSAAVGSPAKSSGTMKFKFKIGGGESASPIGGEGLDREILQKTRAELTARIAGIRCPEHHQAPTLEFAGESLMDMKIHVKACCQALRQRALAALATNEEP